MRTDFDFDFMGRRQIALGCSALLLLVCIFALGLRGLNFGLDFSGGTLVEVEFAQDTAPDEVRSSLAAAGLENAVVQNFGTPRDLLVRLPPQEGIAQETLGDTVLQQLSDDFGRVELRRSEFVGPAVGEELRVSGGYAMLAALALVMVYILFRFSGKFSIGAVLALAHDVIIVIGVFALTQLSFDLATLAAVLAVIGYSLNDTIVVSDRIRENFRAVRRGKPEEIINVSLNQTLARTLVTSLTTLLVLCALLAFGGEIIRGFAIALTVGVVVGTYSSIYVASNVLLLLGITRDDLLEPVKEGADQDDAPRF